MLVATKLLKAPRARTSLKVVPRTIEWVTLLSVAGFALAGLIVGLAVFGGARLQAVLSTTALAGAIGYMAPTLSPLEGESILTWIGLKAQSATARRVTVNGKRSRMYIGTYPLKRSALGPVRFLPSGGNVSSPEYDSRGYPIFDSRSSHTLLAEQRRHRKSGANRKSQLKPSTTLTGHGAPPRKPPRPSMPDTRRRRRQSLSANQSIKQRGKPSQPRRKGSRGGKRRRAQGRPQPPHEGR